MTPEEFDAAYAAASDEQKALLAADPSRSWADPTLPVYRLFARLTLEGFAQQFANGDRRALLAAIRECARCDMPLPPWASRAYIAAYDAVLNCRVKTWDEAFGPAFPKGANLNAQRKRRDLRFAVSNAVLAVIKRNPEIPIDAGLFEAIGAQFNLGKTETESLYRSAIRRGAVDAAEWKKRNGWK